MMTKATFCRQSETSHETCLMFKILRRGQGSEPPAMPTATTARLRTASRADGHYCPAVTWKSGHTLLGSVASGGSKCKSEPAVPETGSPALDDMVWEGEAAQANSSFSSSACLGAAAAYTG